MLELKFSADTGRVQVSCDDERLQSLQFLRSRFASSTNLSPHVFEVDVDDLLVNLNELTNWPINDDDIRWEPELLQLVEANAADANTVNVELQEVESPRATSLWTPRDGGDSLLTDFQLRDVRRLLALKHGANFSVPGAGKTRSSLAVFDARRNEGEVERLIVVCPKSAYGSWTEEAGEYFGAGNLRVGRYDDGDDPGVVDVLLLNYERVASAQSQLIHWMRRHPTMLVLDEAHRMKLGARGAWGSACLAIAPYARHRLILSGTPAPNGAQDLENLFAFVWPGNGRASVRSAMDSGDLRVASRQLRPLFVRTTKHELSLPTVTPVVHRLPLPDIHRDIYRALQGQASSMWPSAGNSLEALGRVAMYLLMAATTPALLATGTSRYEPLPYRVPPLEPRPGSSLESLLRDLPSFEMSPKYQEVLKIVADNAAANRKTLVWSTFVRNLTSLELLLRPFSPALVHGQTTDREEQLRRFRNDPSCMVLLSNPATLGEGVSLHHECHDAIYVDRDFAAGRFLQSLDRIHRLGLPPDVETRITVLMSEGTIDEIVDVRLAAKLRFLGSVLDDEAVLQLADLDEEVSASIGMDATDMRMLLGHLEGHATA